MTLQLGYEFVVGSPLSNMLIEEASDLAEFLDSRVTHHLTMMVSPDPGYEEGFSAGRLVNDTNDLDTGTFRILVDGV